MIRYDVLMQQLTVREYVTIKSTMEYLHDIGILKSA